MKKGDDKPKYQKLLIFIRDIQKEKDNANEVFKTGKLDEAIEAYTKVLEFDPENKMFNSQILANRALCHQKKKCLLDALTDINKSLAYNDKYTKVMLYLFICLGPY
jgi:DnaJ family protein C protein 7